MAPHPAERFAAGYFPHLGFKWLPRVATGLKWAPADLPGRLAALFTATPAEAVEAADALIEDTLTLVEARMPEA
jgi:hypothetical protein